MSTSPPPGERPNRDARDGRDRDSGQGPSTDDIRSALHIGAEVGSRITRRDNLGYFLAGAFGVVLIVLVFSFWRVFSTLDDLRDDVETDHRELSREVEKLDDWINWLSSYHEGQPRSERTDGTEHSDNTNDTDNGDDDND